MKFPLAATLLLCLSGLCLAEPDEPTIRSLIEQLDNDEFPIRQQAAAELAKIGAPAVPLLRATQSTGTFEQKTQTVRILRTIQTKQVLLRFEQLGQADDSEINVEAGMILIAQLIDPAVTTDAITQQLDAAADAVRNSLGKNIDPKSLTATEVITALIKVLRDELQLDGDHELYDHPDNSSIDRVFQQGDGLPIVLSEIAVAIGKRLEVPITGIAVPRHYMFKYDTGEAKTDILVDAFNQWKITSADEVALTWRTFDPDEDLQPSNPRDTIIRMLNNLASDYLETGEPRQATIVQKCRERLEPANQPPKGT